jgi:hypothetical protein
MLFSLDNLVGRLPEPEYWERQLAGSLFEKIRLNEVGFLAAWEVQSYLATAVLVAFVGFLSPLAAVPVMLGWSLVAAAVYFFARKRGLPNLLEVSPAGERRSRNLPGLCAGLAVTAVKAWLGGAQAFVYSRTVCRVLGKPAHTPARRLCRLGVVGLGLTLFGVTAADHILRRAGYTDGKLLRLSLLGPFLNVPYRVALSAAVVNAFLAGTRVLSSGLAGISPV